MARPTLSSSLSAALGLALGLPALAQLPANAVSSAPAAVSDSSAATASRAAHPSSSVSFQNGQLTVNATNASLTSILHEIARSTGMKLSGSVPEDRVFGTYGPADPQQVMSTLLDGTGTNILIVSNSADKPLELHLSPRTAAPTPPNPNADADPGEAVPPHPLPEPENDNDGNDCQSPGHGPRRFGKPEAPDPAAATAPSESNQPLVFPSISPTTAPATGTTTPVDPDDGTDTTTEGVKTPQQIFEQLQRLQQTNTGSGNSTNPASNNTNNGNAEQDTDTSQQ